MTERRHRLTPAQRLLLEALTVRGPMPTIESRSADNVWYVSVVCAAALERAGLVEGHYRGTPSVWAVDITEAGRQALAKAQARARS